MRRPAAGLYNRVYTCARRTCSKKYGMMSGRACRDGHIVSAHDSVRASNCWQHLEAGRHLGLERRVRRGRAEELLAAARHDRGRVVPAAAVGHDGHLSEKDAKLAQNARSWANFSLL